MQTNSTAAGRAALGGLRIAFLMPGPPRRHPVWSPVAEHLTQRGATVEMRFVDHALTGIAPVEVEHDLYVVKATSGLGLSLAGALHAAGAALFNPYPVVALCRDKVQATQVLAAAGVPVPETWVTEDREDLRPLLEGGPIVVKPSRGSRGIGVHVVGDEAALERLASGDGLLFVQRHHPPDGDGLDHKLYCIDGEVFGVRRVWPSRTWEDKLGRPFEPDAELREIARRCASAIGTTTFGFDVVYSGGRPYVVDLSGLPGFKGVPFAERRLAAAIAAAARRVRDGGRVEVVSR
jgi:glutathione synthase/RimK-type ligase-like ATP-grasp enzyme